MEEKKLCQNCGIYKDDMTLGGGIGYCSIKFNLTHKNNTCEKWRPKKTAIIAQTRTNWRKQRLMEFSAQELRAELRRRNKEYKRQEKQDDCTDGICKL